jgi:hypothetical protein
MRLFLLAIFFVVLYVNRKYLRRIAGAMNARGVALPALKNFEKQYPTYVGNVRLHLRKFNDEYQKTFGLENAHVCTVNRLFSIREDVLHNISEIRLRLSNDLDLEKMIVRIRDTADRRMMEYITDAKSRFNLNVYPGQTSSAFSSKQYRASNDVVE